jgi:ribosome-associated protein
VNNSVVINTRISIPMSELSFQFARASGPGGQNVNRVESAVELSFDLVHTPFLTEVERERVRTKLGSLVDSNGVLHIVAQSERSQLRNREEVILRFTKLLRDALITPKARRPTRPSRRAKENRLVAKKRAGETKRLRQQRVSVE